MTAWHQPVLPLTSSNYYWRNYYYLLALIPSTGALVLWFAYILFLALILSAGALITGV